MSAVRADRHGRVVRLTLARPEEMNAINTELITELGTHVDSAAGDPTVGVVVIAAEGRAFCAGADLKEALAKTGDAGDFRTWLLTWRHVFRRIETMQKPVIAAVQGMALAGGLELVLSCDVVVASSQARFGDAHINYGLVPGGGGSKRLPEAVGTRTARWLMYTGEVIDAERAFLVGLRSSSCPPRSSTRRCLRSQRRWPSAARPRLRS
jgi:enoyl-CoA hydratase/carnithine racemase